MTMANPIDFNTGLTLEAIETAATLGSDKSTWVKTLTNLAEGVKAGQGKYDTFYKIGTFKNASGASTAIRSIKEKSDRLPAEFDLRPVPRVDPNDANLRTSELWAAVAEPDDDEDLDEVEEVEENEVEDGDTDDTGDEVVDGEEVEEAPAPTKARNARKR